MRRSAGASQARTARSILLALLLHLLPGVVQQNQPWIAFAMPCTLVLAWTLRRGGRIIAAPDEPA